MKKILIALLVGLIWGACTEEKVWEYSSEEDYIYIPYESAVLAAGMDVDSTWFFYNKSSLTVNSTTQQRDTFMLHLKIAGTPKSVDRQIRLQPWDFEIAGKQVAVAGVNYVAFDDSEMEKALVLPADSASIHVPIIVMYDQATADATTAYSSYFIVPFELVDSEGLNVMGTNSDITVVDMAARTHFYVQFTQTNN